MYPKKNRQMTSWTKKNRIETEKKIMITLLKSLSPRRTDGRRMRNENACHADFDVNCQRLD